MKQRTVFVDVDDTLVRSIGYKRVPMLGVVAAVRDLYQRGTQLYLWSSGGADYAIIQSLIVTCRLHGINPYTYLMDVLLRIGEHPASQAQDLIPRRWKQMFADNPLHLDLGTA